MCVWLYFVPLSVLSRYFAAMSIQSTQLSIKALKAPVNALKTFPAEIAITIMHSMQSISVAIPRLNETFLPRSFPKANTSKSTMEIPSKTSLIAATFPVPIPDINFAICDNANKSTN